jgi:Xaa-Pro dipeptidase
MPNIEAIQSELRARKMDGWLFYDHHHRDPIAVRILGLSNGMATRRWFYFIPVKGEPRKLVNRIESNALDSLPGRKLEYSSWEELHKSLRQLVKGAKVVAMQYSPENNIPYIGLVDAGTVELVHRFVKRIVSSADLVQKFEATWTPEQLESHLEAGKIIERIKNEAFALAAALVRGKQNVTEYDLQQWMMNQFRAQAIVTDDPPVAAVGPNSGLPHYEPKADSSQPIRAGDLLLLDIWGKLQKPGSVYYDITWMGYLGDKVPSEYTKIFGIVRKARDTAIEFIKEKVAKGRPIHGWEVDRAARNVIRKAGYAENFFHRTGHSIGQDVHGNGANMDGIETRDDRTIMPHTCFSIEPGIYLPKFGIRSEVNVYVGDRDARVTTSLQEEIIPLLA